MGINDEFQPGFGGQLGTGPGQHTASRLERMDHTLMNKLENAMYELWSLMEGQGHYGPFQLETTSGYIEETFDGNGKTTEFILSKSIPKEAISGYDILLSNPYASGIEPLSGYLTGFSTATNLTNIVQFPTAPPVGTGNVVIKYVRISQWSSSLNTSAFLSDTTISN